MQEKKKKIPELYTCRFSYFGNQKQTVKSENTLYENQSERAIVISESEHYREYSGESLTGE